MSFKISKSGEIWVSLSLSLSQQYGPHVEQFVWNFQNEIFDLDRLIRSGGQTKFGPASLARPLEPELSSANSWLGLCPDMGRTLWGSLQSVVGIESN